MKKVIKLNLGVVVAVVIGLTTMSFKLIEVSNLQTQWVFTGDEDGDILNPEAWEPNGEMHEDCDGIGDLPCSIELSGDQPSDIEAYLQGKSEGDVLDDSPNKRPSQTFRRH